MRSAFAKSLVTWIQSDTGLLARITVGVLIFTGLALVDLRRNGRKARRWREYVFLLFAVFAALGYGVANDLITCRISPEYFLYGKDLAPVVGDRFPPDMRRLSWEAAKVGLKATWTVGLIIGVALLIANNPRSALPQLRYSQLIARVPLVFVAAVLMALALGELGYRGGLISFSQDFREMVHADQWRPYRFMAVYGIHLGGYFGGILGTVAACISIRRARRPTNRSGGFPIAQAPLANVR